MTRWIVPGVNLALLAFFAPRAGQSSDHAVSYAIFAVLAALTSAPAVRALIGERLHPGREAPRSSFSMAVDRLKGNPMAMVALAVLAVLAYAAILAPFVAPYDPIEMNWEMVHQAPSRAYWLGTDDLGRDIFSRAVYALRIALGLAVLAVALNTVFGTTLGLVAGYYGGKIDAAVMRVLEIVNSIPFILLAIALMAALGTGFVNLVFVVSISGILAFARMIRGAALSIRKQEYLAAAKIIGLPNRLIIVRHVLPNCVAPIIVMSSLRLGTTILELATLSFLGLGIQPPTPSLGAMLSEGQQFIYQNFMMSLVPGTLILLTVLSFNLFGDGLRDALDTRIKGV